MDFQKTLRSLAQYHSQAEWTKQCLFLFFWLHWVLAVAHGIFQCTGCSSWTTGCSMVGSVVALHGHRCRRPCGVLVFQPGIKPASPALEGRFITTRPAGKSRQNNFLIFLPSKQWEIHCLKREASHLSTIICYSTIQ